MGLCQKQWREENLGYISREPVPKEDVRLLGSNSSSTVVQARFDSSSYNAWTHCRSSSKSCSRSTNFCWRSIKRSKAAAFPEFSGILKCYVQQLSHLPCSLMAKLKSPLSAFTSQKQTLTIPAAGIGLLRFREFPDHSMGVLPEGQESSLAQKDAELSQAKRLKLFGAPVCEEFIHRIIFQTFHKWTNKLNCPLNSWPHTVSHGAGCRKWGRKLA